MSGSSFDPAATAGAFLARDREWHPAAFTPGYKTSVLRSPRRPLVALDATLSEIAGPVFGHEMIGERDNDLITNFAAPGETAIHHLTENRPLAQMSWQELGRQVRIVATRLRALGLRPGDRIVSYMPNVPETTVAMLASMAIGAVWSSAAPEFGTRTVVERFAQIKPKLIFACDGYRFGGVIGRGVLFARQTHRAVGRVVVGLIPDVQTLVLGRTGVVAELDIEQLQAVMGHHVFGIELEGLVELGDGVAQQPLALAGL